MAKINKLRVDPLQNNTNWISTWCILGFLLSLYSLYVEIQHERDKNFRALCDINEAASCTRVFMSKYGKGFGIFPKPFDVPNPVIGIFFYMNVLFVTLFSGQNWKMNMFVVVNSVISNLRSIYFAYILFFVLKDICVVCISLYVINFFLLVASVNRSLNSTMGSKNSHTC